MTTTKILRGMCIAASLFLFVAAPINGQTLSPILGLGTIQVLDNTGALATNAVLYFYAAGTTTQQATFTDSGGQTTNVNPLPLSSGARATVWLTSGQAYKIVGCLQNDGPVCSAADVLFSQDNVIPGSASNSGTCATGCLGFYISSTSSPATSGVLRCASGDTCLAFRNTAGSANLGLTKDTNDLLSWPTPLKFPENAGATGVAGFDLLWPDNSVHRWKMANNGGSAVQVVASGNDISNTDSVTAVHFGSSQAPISSTLPSTNQYLQWSGSAIVGTGSAVDLTAQAANISNTTIITPSANGFYSAACWVVETQAATTSSTLPQCTVSFTDADTSVVIGIPLNNTNVGNTIGSVGLPLQPGFFYAKSGQAIQYRTAGYVSSGGTPMQYALHFRLVGPF